MEENQKKQAVPGAMSGDDTGRHMVAAILFGVLAGAQWPEYFLLAAIIGIFVHQRFARNNWVSFVVSLVYVPTCMIYHLFFSRISYQDIGTVNFNYLVSALVVAFAAMSLTVLKKSWLGFLILFIAVLPGLFITNTQQPVLFAVFLLMVPLVYFIKPFGSAHSLLVFVAVLNSFLAAGVITVNMAAPPFPENSVIKRIPRDDFKVMMPDIYERVTTKERVSAAVEGDRKKYGKGVVRQVLNGRSSGDLYVLISRGNGSRILVLDPKTLEIKRESFDGIAGGGVPWMDVSEARGLAVVTKGNSVYTVDLKTLEWVDSIKRGVLESGIKVCFLNDEKIVYFISRYDTSVLVQYNQHGQLGDTAEGVFSNITMNDGLYCDHVNNRVFIGSRFHGLVEYVNFNKIGMNLKESEDYSEEKKPDGILYVGNFINHENLYVDGKRIWFSVLPGGNDDFAYVDIADMNEPEPAATIRGKVISYFVLPISFSRDMENTP